MNASVPSARNYNLSDNDTSTRDFEQRVWGSLTPHLNGELIRIEGAAALARQLSKLDVKTKTKFDAISHAALLQLWDSSGWDFCLKDGPLMRGLAVRVQHSSTDPRIYRTITLRAERFDKRTGKCIPSELVELHKRYTTYQRRDEGFINPHFTIHAYVDVWGGLLRVAVVRTKDLCALIESKGGPTSLWTRSRYTKVENAYFVPIGFDEVPAVVVIDHFGQALVETRELAAKMDVVEAARSVARTRGWSPRARIQLTDHVNKGWP